MKARTLAVAAGISVPSILGGSASAEFVQVSTTSKPNPFGLMVINVYAEFDRPGEDFMVAVAGTPDTPLNVVVENGIFFQHPFGADLAPPTNLVAIFPDLAFDTFVTIGIKQVGLLGQPANFTVITPALGFAKSTLTTDQAGWVILPNQAPADPFDPVNSYPGDGRILIAQFSTVGGTAIYGTMLIQFISNGVPGQAHVCFDQDGSCNDCEGDCGNFDDDVGIIDFLALLAQWGRAGTACDLDGGGVGITDFLLLLGNWGPCLQQPNGACCLPGDTCEQRTQTSCHADGGTWQLAATSCDDFNGRSSICTAVCPSDCHDMNGIVDVHDYLALLSEWAMFDALCNIGLGDPGVGINDLLNLLGNFGPCP